MGEMKRRNRNNRQRGNKLEKKVADYLEMFPVPYSGSNDRFGWGDIRDIEGAGIGGYWTGECKSITPDGAVNAHVIKRTWLNDIKRKADEYCTSWFLAFNGYRSPVTYIMIDDNCALYIDKVDRQVELAKQSHNVVNYRIPKHNLPSNNEIIEVKISGDEHSVYIMRLDLFKEMIMSVKLHEKFSRI